MARSTGRLERVEPAAVDWIEACGNYARLHLDGRSVLLRRTLSSLADELADAGFVRVHRSSIVNTARVVGMRRRDHGEGLLELAGGETIRVSRTYRDAVEGLFS